MVFSVSTAQRKGGPVLQPVFLLCPTSFSPPSPNRPPLRTPIESSFWRKVSKHTRPSHTVSESIVIPNSFRSASSPSAISVSSSTAANSELTGNPLWKRSSGASLFLAHVPYRRLPLEMIPRYRSITASNQHRTITNRFFKPGKGRHAWSIQRLPERQNAKRTFSMPSFSPFRI